MKIINQANDDVLLKKFIGFVLDNANLSCEEIVINDVKFVTNDIRGDITLTIDGEMYFFRIRPCSFEEEDNNKTSIDIAQYKLQKTIINNGWYCDENISTGIIKIEANN